MRSALRLHGLYSVCLRAWPVCHLHWSPSPLHTQFPSLIPDWTICHPLTQVKLESSVHCIHNAIDYREGGMGNLSQTKCNEYNAY